EVEGLEPARRQATPNQLRAVGVTIAGWIHRRQPDQLAREIDDFIGSIVDRLEYAFRSVHEKSGRSSGSGGSGGSRNFPPRLTRPTRPTAVGRPAVRDVTIRHRPTWPT